MPYKDVEYRRKRDLDNWHSARNELIQKLGGECVNCKTKDDLEFDHIDPMAKQINIQLLIKGRHWDHSEIKKIQLLCKSCHKKKSIKYQNEVATAKHGSGRTAYNRCKPSKCMDCKEWNRTHRGGYKRIIII